MLNRRGFLRTVSVSLLAAPLVAEAQPTAKVWRIGFIAVSPVKYEEAFLQRLGELGYVEGQNLITERRYSEGRTDRFPEFAAELVRLKVDIIVVTTTPAALAVKSTTKTIPVVFPTAIDPVAAGVVASLARPGGNITGLTMQAPELVGKRLQFLKEAIPRLSRVAMLWNAANPANARPWRQAQDAARALGVTLRSQEVRGPTDFERVFAVMARERPDALLFQGDGLPRRSPRGGAHQVRAGHQSEDGQGARAHDPAVPVGAGGSGHRAMIGRRAFVSGLAMALVGAPTSGRAQTTVDHLGFSSMPPHRHRCGRTRSSRDSASWGGWKAPVSWSSGAILRATPPWRPICGNGCDRLSKSSSWAALFASARP
jgi:hypothetical protein